MLCFTTTIEKFGAMGEKTGWRYVVIDATRADTLKPNVRVSFRVRGTIDSVELRGAALLPMGDGTFILPLNAPLRKALHKDTGDSVALQLEEDPDGYVMNEEFLDAVRSDSDAENFFATLPGSHQRYFSKWMDSAKTDGTRQRRIVQAVVALSRRMGYTEMIRAQKM